MVQGQPHDIRVLEELFEGEERGLDSESRSLEEDAFPFHQDQPHVIFCSYSANGSFFVWAWIQLD